MSKKYEGKYIVRCDRAGVFYGEIDGVEGNVVSMRKVRKLWLWSGAAAVEQLSNLQEAADDILVAYGILADDCYRIVASHDGSRCLVDRDRPRTEIWITEVE